MNNIIKPRKRRGLSSIIGALFFIILMIATFTALLTAFSYQNDLINTQKKLSDRQTAIAREDFSLSGNISSTKLFLTVRNEGTDTVNIKDLWVIEKNTSEKLAIPYKINFTNATIAVATSKNVTNGQITLDPTDQYTIKVVSELGTMKTLDIPDMTIAVGPPGKDGADGSPGDPSSLLILNEDLLNKPGIFLTTPSPFGNSPNNDKALWGATIANPTDQTMEVGKIVFTVSSPRASSADQIFSVGGSSPPSGDNCGPSPTTILPNPNTNAIWRCTTENQLVWTNTTSAGALIPARSAKSFFTSISPGSLQSAGDVDGFLIAASVFTNMGQFGKTAYMSSFRNVEGVIANVYLSDTIGSTGTDHMFGDFTMSSGGTRDVYINLADFEQHADSGAGGLSTNYIKSGAQVIVNVPRNFTVTTTPATIVSNSPGFSSVVFYNDTKNDSVQIQATTNVDIGNLPKSGSISPAEARTLKFTIRAPELSSDKLYVMYTLGRGNYIPVISTSPAIDADIGPLAEILIRVEVP
ncbi:MAG TPA: hypothetical protein VLD64_08115 [Nitrosarchaeum sp.]|nr:hypothetical protein [Nitrosarchaeum sp.]